MESLTRNMDKTVARVDLDNIASVPDTLEEMQVAIDHLLFEGAGIMRNMMQAEETSDRDKVSAYKALLTLGGQINTRVATSGKKPEMHIPSNLRIDA